MYFDPLLDEQLSALAWGIPLYEWYGLPRALRISHMAVNAAKALIEYYNSGGE